MGKSSHARRESARRVRGIGSLNVAMAVVFSFRHHARHTLDSRYREVGALATLGADAESVVAVRHATDLHHVCIAVRVGHVSEIGREIWKLVDAHSITAKITGEQVQSSDQTIAIAAAPKQKKPAQRTSAVLRSHQISVSFIPFLLPRKPRPSEEKRGSG